MSDSLTSKSVIPFSLNGKKINALKGESILQAAKRADIEIPHLCYKEGYRTDGNCRACVVEIEGERILAASCCRQPTPDMKVHSHSVRAIKSQKMVFELLLSNMPTNSKSDQNLSSKFDYWKNKLDVNSSRFKTRKSIKKDHSNPAIKVDLNACIQCNLCVRGCCEEQVNQVIGSAFRGLNKKIVFDLDDDMGHSTCVSCGECVQACPTQALQPAQLNSNEIPDKSVSSICPYCGVGCLLTYHVKEGRIIRVDGNNSVTNKSRLCVKGRYGFDYIHHQRRLTKPLIRRQGIAKSKDTIMYENRLSVFREASWEEALAFASTGFNKICQEKGSHALAGFGSAKGSNEEAYLFQKLIRSGFGNNNVDHCTRMCHASSVTAMLEGLGSAAVSNQVADVSKAEVIIIIGAKPTVNHPVAATFFKNEALAGKTLIVLDPYRSDLAKHAKHFLQFNADTDVPLLNAMMFCIIEENLQNNAFIEKHTDGFDIFKENIKKYSPDKVSAICGVAAENIRQVARLYATSKGSIIFWGMGVSQHVHGTDNARCLIALALMTGQIGREGCGLHPLRGQNNVQGASDVGLIPMFFPNYQSVNNAQAHHFFENLWQTKLDSKPGLTVVEIIHAIHDKQINGLYVEGENPAMSDPNLNYTRKALSHLDHLVVQDLFFTETASYADVILPGTAFAEKNGTFTNTDRRVQMGRQAVEPPGEAKQDLWIIQKIAQGMGLDWNYNGPEDVFSEIRQAMPSLAGMTWQRLLDENSLTYPLKNEGEDGQETLFINGFPTATGRAKFVAATYLQADELPDKEYPLVFTTGRQLEHWHTGTMTRNASVLDKLEPDPIACMHPDDLKNLAINAGGQVKIKSRRGELVAYTRRDKGILPGTIFMAFCYSEAAANLLTNEVLDPFAKIPEFKYCAVNVTPT